MRLLSSLLGGVIVAIAAVLLTLFALENTQVVSLSFLGTHFSGNIWWLVLGAAAIGFVLAMLLLVPGRMVTDHRAYNLSQLNARHEHDLADLRDTHAQLQTERDHLTTEHARLANESHSLRDELAAARSDRDAARQERDQLRTERDQLHDERERVTSERDQLRERLAAASAVAPVNASGYRPTVEPALMGAATSETAASADREDQVLPGGAQEQTPGEPEMPVAQPIAETETAERGDQVMAREPVVTQPARPSLGERVRAAVTGRSAEEVQAQDQAKNDQLTDQSRESPPAEQSPSPSDMMPEARAEAVGEPAAPETMDSGSMVDRSGTEAANAEPAESNEPPMPEAHPQASMASSAESPAPTAHVAPEADHAMPAALSPATEPANAPTPEPEQAERADTVATAGEAPAAAATEPEETAQPTLGERLRAMFHQPESAPEGEESPPPEQAADQTSQQPTM